MRSNNMYTQLGHQTISVVKNREQDKMIPEKNLRKAYKDSSQILLSVKTVFPLTLFTDTVTVDRTKLTIIKRFFFQMGEVTSMRLEDVLNVTASTGPFFGAVKITSRIQGGTEKPLVVNKLWRDDALRLKRILQGYVIAVQKEIDCSALSTPELAKMLDGIGE